MFREDICVDEVMVYVGRGMIRTDDGTLDHLTNTRFEAAPNTVDDMGPVVEDVETTKHGFDGVGVERGDYAAGIKRGVCTSRHRGWMRHICCSRDSRGRSYRGGKGDRPRR